MNFRRSWNYYLKRLFFYKKTTWINLFLHLVVAIFIFRWVKANGWFLGLQREIKNSGTTGHGIPVNPTINNINDFFSCVLPNLIVLPFLFLTCVFSPIAWLFWGWIEEVAQKTQKDGTDLFFLSTEVPTNRKQIFWGKVFFLFSSLVGLYLITYALPFSLLLWRSNYFVNFTATQTFLFLTWNFLITPLLFFGPLVIFLLSLASLDSVWYNIVKWLLSFMVVLFFIPDFLPVSWKIFDNFLTWKKNHYLLISMTILGVIIFLTLFALRLAYKKFQKKDLI